jgi:hypothetical protein
VVEVNVRVMVVAIWPYGYTEVVKNEASWRNSLKHKFVVLIYRTVQKMARPPKDKFWSPNLSLEGVLVRVWREIVMRLRSLLIWNCKSFL